MIQHPLSAAFPSMSQDEIQSLANDISANGQREPGIIFEGMVIDGWHRYQACKISGVEFDSRPLPKYEDPVLFVKSRNLHRRHLTGSQRAAAVVACNSWAPASRPIKVEPGATLIQPEAVTNAEMAKEAGVSERTIRHAKAAEKAGLADDVRDGKVSAKKAAEKANGKITLPPKRLYTKQEATQEPDDAPNMAELAGELQTENEAMQRQIASLQTGDTEAELVRMNRNYDALNGRLQGEISAHNEAKKQAQYYSDILAKIRKFLGVEKNSQIMSALKK